MKNKILSSLSFVPILIIFMSANPAAAQNDYFSWKLGASQPESLARLPASLCHYAHPSNPLHYRQKRQRQRHDQPEGKKSAIVRSETEIARRCIRVAQIKLSVLCTIGSAQRIARGYRRQKKTRTHTRSGAAVGICMHARRQLARIK